MSAFNLTRNLNRYSPTQVLFCSKTALYENQILLKWKSRITLQSMRKQCCGDWRPFSSIRISKYKMGLRCDRQPIWNQYLFTGKSEKRRKTERFLSIPNHGNSKAQIWNSLRFVVNSQRVFFFWYEIIWSNCRNANNIPSYSLTLLRNSKSNIYTVIVS
jgi:hypothetical protein